MEPTTPSPPPAPGDAGDLQLTRSTTMLLDVTTYSVLVVMGLLGVAGIDGAAQRAGAVALCLAFAALHAVAWSRPRTRPRWRLFLGCQTLLVCVLGTLPSTDYAVFGFLLYVLSVHAALLFTAGEAAGWIAGFWLVSGGISWWHRGSDGLFEIVFSLGVFPLCGVLGHALRELAQAKASGEVTLRRLRAAQDRVEELAVVNERHRLAHDLHDSVKQQVFATTMQLGAARALIEADPAAARAALDEADASAQKAASELNQVIHALRPSELADHGLAETLRSQARQWARHSGVLTNVRVRGEPPAAAADTEETVLRVAQEALANAARHSGADRIDLDLHYLPSGVRLRVRDDGRGFDPARRSVGVGLESMRSRVRKLGGRLEIRSGSGTGTTVDALLSDPDDRS